MRPICCGERIAAAAAPCERAFSHSVPLSFKTRRTWLLVNKLTKVLDESTHQILSQMVLQVAGIVSTHTMRIPLGGLLTWAMSTRSRAWLWPIEDMSLVSLLDIQILRYNFIVEQEYIPVGRLPPAAVTVCLGREVSAQGRCLPRGVYPSLH